MKVTSILKQLEEEGKHSFSIEILPPLKGTGIEQVIEAIAPVISLRPEFINITFHPPVLKSKERPAQEPFIYETHPRPATAAVAGELKRLTGIEVIPHLASANYTKLELEDFIIDFSYERLENIFAVRADRHSYDTLYNTRGHKHTEGLVAQIADLRKGILVDEGVGTCKPMDFCIGVAGYPEGHPELESTYNEYKYLKQKVEAGADYIITQMFFDNRQFYWFVEQCRLRGINVPIIPGIKPLSTYKQIQTLPDIFGINIPEELELEFNINKDNPDKLKEIGMNWCRKQTVDLIAHGFPLVHYFTMGKTQQLSEMLKRVFV